MLSFVLFVFLVFIIAFPIVIKLRKNEAKEDLIKMILVSKPNPDTFNNIRHLGQEDFDGWIWNSRKVRELSYKELLKIYNILTLR